MLKFFRRNPQTPQNGNKKKNNKLLENNKLLFKARRHVAAKNNVKNVNVLNGLVLVKTNNNHQNYKTYIVWQKLHDKIRMIGTITNLSDEKLMNIANSADKRAKSVQSPNGLWQSQYTARGKELMNKHKLSIKSLGPGVREVHYRNIPIGTLGSGTAF